MLESLKELKEENISEKWIKYLCKTNNKIANYERIDSLKEINSKSTYNYVVKNIGNS